MQNFEQRVQTMLDEHEVLVAVFTTETSILDGMEAKRVFREFQMEILNRQQPTKYWNFVGRNPKTFIYGVTARMKESDENYLTEFLNACGDGTYITEIIGMTMNGT